MFLIRTKSSRYWTSNYEEDRDFYSFTSETKDGLVRIIKVKKDEVIEIVNLGSDYHFKK